MYSNILESCAPTQAHTTGMKTLLIEQFGKRWDAIRGGKTTMRKFWNSYCVEPWDCWTVGEFEVPLCTPSQQAQESWHRQLQTSRVPGMFRGSMELCMQVALPQMIRMDGLLNADQLKFKVSACLYTCMTVCMHILCCIRMYSKMYLHNI